MIDFVTIIFNDENEINLLKLQACTFSFIDIKIINKIYVFFNDDVRLLNGFKQKFYSEIINLYPSSLHQKIYLLCSTDIGINFGKSTWFSQQVAKIQISKYIDAKYYIVLDGKNHFKGNINYDDFFYNKKPLLIFNSHGDAMLKYYYNCLNYFGIECPMKNSKNIKIQTTTPFIFIREICIELMNYIKNKENTEFSDFINNKKLYTEFFLYYSFLFYTHKNDLYHYSNQMKVITIGAVDPNIHQYNSWENKKPQLESADMKIIALHRRSFNYLDKKYKSNLIKFYENKYNNIKINEIIHILLK